MNLLPTLPSPRIPDNDDGIIDKSDYDNDNVYAFVSYQKITPGDTINLFLDNNEIGNRTVPEGHPSSAFIQFPISQQMLTNGTHTIDYMVTDGANNTSQSISVIIYVNKDEYAEKITAPTIIGDDDGCLTTDEINAYSGAIVHIPKTDSLSNNIGHELVINWIGFDVNGVPVINGNATYTVTIDNSNISGFNWTVPYDIVMASLNGRVNVYYYINVNSERVYSDLVTIGIGTCEQNNLKIILSSDQNEIDADGQDTATITAFVFDQLNMPVSNILVQWSTNQGAVAPLSSVTGADGKCSTSLSSFVVGTLTVTGRLASGEFDDISVSAISPNTIYIYELVSNKTEIIADGVDSATLTCTVLNSMGVPIGGETVFWSSNSGILDVSQTSTDGTGHSNNQLSAAIPGLVTVTARLSNNSSKSIQLLATEKIEEKNLKIMGARVTLNGYGRYHRPRLVALDRESLQPVDATWVYADHTGTTTGFYFNDSKPEQIIRVSAPGYKSLEVNISNIAGNGGFIDDGIGPGAFMAIMNNGKLIAWGDEEYGGSTPLQSGTYARAFQNSHSFSALSETSNKLMSWGNRQQGGTLPSNIASRNDILTVRGGFCIYGHSSF